jgi:hypothetical protein
LLSNNIGDIHTDIHGKRAINRGTVRGGVSNVVQPEVYKEDNSLLATMVNSQLKCKEM